MPGSLRKKLKYSSRKRTKSWNSFVFWLAADGLTRDPSRTAVNYCTRSSACRYSTTERRIRRDATSVSRRRTTTHSSRSCGFTKRPNLYYSIGGLPTMSPSTSKRILSVTGGGTLTGNCMELKLGVTHAGFTLYLRVPVTSLDSLGRRLHTLTQCKGSSASLRGVLTINVQRKSSSPRTASTLRTPCEFILDSEATSFRRATLLRCKSSMPNLPRS